jgi:hypothetical protein
VCSFGVALTLSDTLAEHIKKHEVEYIQFAFKWTNCLLVREFHLSVCNHNGSH